MPTRKPFDERQQRRNHVPTSALRRIRLSRPARCAYAIICGRAVKVVQVNYAYAAHMSDHAALLDTYETLTGWSEAVARAGAEVSVVQAFHYDAKLSRNGIDYVFCANDRPSGRIRRACGGVVRARSRPR